MADYFTVDTDLAIEAFQSAEDDTTKHAIFNHEIRPAFEKLIENLIFVYSFFKFGDVDQLKRECLTDLYNTLPKYDGSRSRDPNKITSKSFSYFNKVARNWFVAKGKDMNRRAKNESDLFYDLDHENIKNHPNFMISSYESQVEEREMWDQLYKNMESWRNLPMKKNEREVLEAIIVLMKNSDAVSIYNRKAVYLYLRDLTGLNTKQIVSNMKKIRALYDEWYEKYHSTGETGHETIVSGSRIGGYR